MLHSAYFIGECSCAKSSVDDSGTCRGVVLSRAATILRSIETHPPTGRFVCQWQMPKASFFNGAPGGCCCCCCSVCPAVTFNRQALLLGWVCHNLPVMCDFICLFRGKPRFIGS